MTSRIRLIFQPKVKAKQSKAEAVVSCLSSILYILIINQRISLHPPLHLPAHDERRKGEE
jgi:hypothetical protein